MWPSRLRAQITFHKAEKAGKVWVRRCGTSLIFPPLSPLKIAILSTTWQWTPWRLSLRSICEWPGRWGSKRVAPRVSLDLGQVNPLGQKLALSSLHRRELSRPTRIFSGCSSAVTFGAQNKHFSSGKADRSVYHEVAEVGKLCELKVNML